MAARQLHLFKGKRQRGTKPPPPKEFALHVSLADTLRRWAMPNWIWTHFPAGEERAAVYRDGERVSFAGARLKRMGLRPGFPDFQFFHHRGLCAFLELKREGATPSDDQIVILDFLEHAGHAVMVTDSYSEAVDFLKAIGVLRAGVHVQ